MYQNSDRTYVLVTIESLNMYSKIKIEIYTYLKSVSARVSLYAHDELITTE